MGKFISTLAIAFLCVFAATNLYAADDQRNEKRAKESQRYTVKVGVMQGEILTSEVREKHGTGFVFYLSDEEGIVFTNRHVVETPRRIARRIDLGFFGGADSREKVRGECIFESPLHDFAVIRFDPKELKQLRGHVQAATVPPIEHFDKYSQAGASVMAAGNPFSSQDVRTFGALSGWHPLDREGLMLQTDAAINPGNSGGPLIHLDSGLVIGLNTAKILDGDGIGYVLPITDAIAEYNLFQKRDQYAMRRRLMVATGGIPMSTVKEGLHLEKAIAEESIEPGFYSRYEELFVINSVNPTSKLQKGDIIISVNGTVVGDRTYRIADAVQRSEGATVRIRVIRDYHREVTVDEPVHIHAFPVEATEWDVISFGGFVFEEVNEEVAFLKNGGRTRVIVSRILPGTYAGNNHEGWETSFLASITIGGERTEIQSLADLRKALGKVPKDVRAAMISLYSPLFVYDKYNRRNSAVPDPIYEGMKSLNTFTVEVGVPLEKVYDNRDEFVAARDHFNFSGFGGRPAGMASFTGRAVGCAAEVASPQS